MVNKKAPLKNYIKHKPKRKILIKFSLVLAVFLIYFAFSLIYYGMENGILISFLTWSLFVFCTPIADAGFLLDFPIRLITGLRMIYSEILVWGMALLLNIYSLINLSGTYEKTFLLKLFKTILLNPIPFWLIILLSMAGTFLSVYFGDELLDITNYRQRKKHKKHKNKHRTIVVLFSILFIIILYYYLLNYLGIKI